MLLLRRALFSTSYSKPTTLTPKSLYKYLIRQCYRLPDPEIQKYYRHQVRQSFNQHADETEQDRINQILKQAVKDFDWILKKSLKEMDSMSRNKDSENCQEEMDVSEHRHEVGVLNPPSLYSNWKTYTLQGPVSSVFEFFYAVSVFATRPHILNRCVKGAELILEPIDSSPKFFKCGPHELDWVECNDVPEDIIEELQEPFLKPLIDELNDLGVHRMILKRRVIGNSMREYVAKETWDLQNRRVVIESDETVEPNREFPPVLLVCTLLSDDMQCSLIQIDVSGNENNSRLEFVSLKYYRERILPRIIKWASLNNSSSQESHPGTAPGVPSKSLKYVQLSSYYEEYKRMKDLNFRRLQAIWTENTDPLKFIPEEIGIAAYIKTYIDSVSDGSPFYFVDMGCGNGVLTFTLAAAGASGFGFDIRPRKLWDVFSQLGVQPDLRTQSFNPFCDTIPHRENLWLIGNHADELTPWISVMARRSNAAGYIVIPCCLYDFHGKFQRKAKNSSDSKSLYHNYIHYIAEIGRKCGYNIYIDKLRIPSTKIICIIGISRDPNVSEVDAEAVRKALTYVNSKVSEFPSTDESIGDIPLFKPRNPIEKVNNLSQIDRQVVTNIVGRVFSALVLNDICETVTHPNYLRPWNGGRADFSLREAAELLTKEEREIIQSQGKGLQTLMKNHNQIFRIRNSYLYLRRPLIDDSAIRTSKCTSKIKTQNCYFFFHHPDGCPLPTELCRYKHSDMVPFSY